MFARSFIPTLRPAALPAARMQVRTKYTLGKELLAEEHEAEHHAVSEFSKVPVGAFRLLEAKGDEAPVWWTVCLNSDSLARLPAPLLRS
jgi:hypothetical protein